MSVDADEAIYRGIRFLHDAPIRNADGSVNGAYLERERKAAGVYPEITGYAIATAWICGQFQESGEPIRMAREAAGYFGRLGRAGGLREGAFPHAYRPPGGEVQDCYFSFDNGIILQGLALHHLRLPGDVEPSLLSACADWLVDRMQNPDGSFKAYLDAQGRHRPERGLFFHDQGCLHAKLAIGLLRAHRIGGDARYREAALKVCRWVLGLQDGESGWFWANPARDHVFAHAHCYATEGLAFAYHACGERQFLEAVRRAGQALAARQDPDGAIPAFPRDGRPWLRRLRTARLRGRATDATAQAVDIWLYLDLLSGERRFRENVNRACGWLLSMQIGNGAADAAARGAFRYRRKTPFGFDSGSALRTWASQFSVRALIHCRQAERGALTAERLMETWT